jgi:hypothetical protein
VADTGLLIAGVPLTVATRDGEVSEIVRDRYKGFVANGADDWRLEIDVSRSTAARSHAPLRVTPDGERGQFVVSRFDFTGTVNVSARCARITVNDVNEYSLDSFLRILYSLALVERHGLILHAASLVRDDQVHIFSGPSGSGKSTVASLSADATLLSDELSIVRMTNDGARAYGTPFWGEFARACGKDQAAPATGIYFLHQGPRHTLDAVTPKDALQRLLPNVLFFARDATLTARILEIAAALVEAVPCFDLTFRLDPGFWEVILGD